MHIETWRAKSADLSPAQIQAHRIADNQMATLTEWDVDLLPLELAHLQAANYEQDVCELVWIRPEALALGLQDVAGMANPLSDWRCCQDRKQV